METIEELKKKRVELLEAIDDIDRRIHAIDHSQV